MSESYSVKAILSAVDKGFVSTLKGAGGALDSLGSKIKSGLGFGFLAGAGQQAFSQISSGIRGVIDNVQSSNASWKTFASNLSMLGTSADEIDSVKKDLQDFAEKTIYSASDMATTYSQELRSWAAAASTSSSKASLVVLGRCSQPKKVLPSPVPFSSFSTAASAACCSDSMSAALTAPRTSALLSLMVPIEMY